MIDVNAEFKFFPWENDKQPDFVKNVACFFVKKDEMVTRVLIDHNPGLPFLSSFSLAYFVISLSIYHSKPSSFKQRILHEDTALDGMATKIDILKFALQ